MNCHTSYFFKPVLLFCLLTCCKMDASTQLSLHHTNWVCVPENDRDNNLSLHFDDEILMVKYKNKTLSTLSYTLKEDTLLIVNNNDNPGCPAASGTYHIIFSHSAQLLSFIALNETCDARKKIFITTRPFSYIPDAHSEARDWLQADSATDHIAGISLQKAYDLLKGRRSVPVIVAVIDNGVDINHEDLKKIIWTNTGEIPGNGIDDDHNGYADDIHGWNFRGAKDGSTVENEQSGATQVYLAWKSKYENVSADQLNGAEKKELNVYRNARKEHLEKQKTTSDPVELNYTYNANYNSSVLICNDSSVQFNHYYGSPLMKLTANLSHGTHVAGIIGAERNNEIGMDGIADNVLIMPLTATTATGDERDKDVANAIYYAVNNGARIINMSFSKIYSSNKKLLDDAIVYAEKKNVLIIHSAGNDGVNIDSPENYHYPVAILANDKKASNFITVGWCRPEFDYILAHPGSNYGKQNTDLFAQGSDVFSTVPGNGYDYKSGSSMSAPCVSGVAALLFSYFPELTTAQVKGIIISSGMKPIITVYRPGTKIKVPFSSLSASGSILNAFNAVKMAINMTGSH